VSAAAAGLHRTEQLLLYSMRAWGGARALGLRPVGVVGAILAQSASERAAAFFAAWMQAVEAGARRPIAWACPQGGRPSADEARLIQACGLAPLDLQLSCGLLEPLTADPESAAVLGRSLNLALCAAGWRCPARLRGAPCPKGRPH
jgi:hypothetical protein